MPLSTLPPRWRLVLILSLSLNLLLGGMLLGSVLSIGDRDGTGRMAGEPLIRALPSSDLAAIRRDLPRPDRAARRVRFDALLSALRAEPFDADRVRALLDEQRRLGAQRSRRAEAALIARLAGMSLADRAAYADRLADWAARRSRRPWDAPQR